VGYHAIPPQFPRAIFARAKIALATGLSADEVAAL
jgi:hypothetical protein